MTWSTLSPLKHQDDERLSHTLFVRLFRHPSRVSGGHLNLARTMATLNDDVLYEIFKYFVAVDINGPFTLIQINKTWQYHIVYNCPNMWTWITIDDFIVDLEQRIAVSLELSKDLPLYITICLPSKHNLLTFQRLFRRCVHIFVEAHASTRMMDKGRQKLSLGSCVMRKLQ